MDPVRSASLRLPLFYFSNLGFHDKKVVEKFRTIFLLLLNQVNSTSNYIVKEDCVVLISEIVYVYCGSQASEKQRSGAEALAEIMSKKKGLHKEPTKIHRSTKKFVW